VIAWLGESTVNENMGFFLASSPSSHWSDEDYSRVTALLTKPYFTRAWIVQEFVLAQVLELWSGSHRANADILTTGWLQHIPPFEPFDKHLPYVSEKAKAWQSPGRKLLQYREYWREGKSSRAFAESFRLRALLDSFSTMQCSERVDKVYALLGIAYDAHETANPIKPNYNKSAVEVLIDVLRNQIGRRTPKDMEEHDFVDSLRCMLGVSRVECIRYIAHKFPNTAQHIFVLAAGIAPVASLHFIDTIARWSHAWNSHERPTPSEQQAFDTFVAQSKRGDTSYVDYHWHMCEDRPRFEAVIAQSTKAMMNCIIAATVQNDGINLWSRHHAHGLDLFHILSRSFIYGAEQCTAAIREYDKSKDIQNKDYATFVGSKGIKGIVYGNGLFSTWKGMRIAVFAGAARAQNALLLQQADNSCWYVAGVAHLLDPTLQTTHRGITYSIRHVNGTFQRMLKATYDSSRSRESEGTKKPERQESCTRFCLQYCDVMDLLDLCRCNLLDQNQLECILKESLNAEHANEPHQCSGVGEGCNILRVGSTWSG
jgi:hypothetical protein